MRIITFVTLTILLNAACINPSQPATSNTLPSQPEPAGGPPNSEQQGNAFSIATEAFYQATVKASSSQGQVISLSLTPDHKAEIVTNHLDNSKGTIDAGDWTTLNNGNLMLNLLRKGQQDSIHLEFKTEGEKLVYTGREYGAAGLVLWVKPVAESK